VTNLKDDGSSGSLRSAIANTQSGGTVDFAAGLTGVITLTGGELLIDKNLTVQGPGARAVAINGNSRGRVFEIASNTGVTISGLTIAGGQITGDGTDAFGGGVLNNGALHLNSCVVSGNAVKVIHGGGSKSATGGGISNGGTLSLDGTTVSGNTADGGDGLTAVGGGITNTGSLMITNSTIVGNTASGGAMGIDFGGGIATGGNVILFSTTVARNRSATGGGLSITNATIVIQNTLIALNTAGTSPDVDGNVNTADHDLLGSDSGTNIHNGQNNNRTGTGGSLLDPKLGVLQDNGGSVPTVALLSGSPAIDAGTTTNIPNTDQRGFKRVVNNTPDIGAYEFQPPATTTGLSVSPSTAAVNQSLTLTITVRGTAPGSNGASGTVAIFDGNVQLGTANLNNGQATFSTQFSSAGTRNLSARFPGFSQGDYRLDPSSSNPIPVNVGNGGGGNGGGGNGGPLHFFAVGGGGRVQLRRTSDGALLYDFAPYGNAYAGPVTVAMGDIHHTGFPDLVTGAGAGNPHVKVFDGKALANGTFNVSNPDANALASFFAYALQFNVGVNVAVGDIENNGFPDIVTGATVGNPDVRVYRGKDLVDGTFNPTGSSLIAQWFAFGLNINVGANVAAGNVSGNGFADVVVGATAGNPNVRVYNGQDIAQRTFDPTGHSLLASFFPFALGEDMGAFVAVGDVNGDGFADIIAGASIGDAFAHFFAGVPIATAVVGVYNGRDIANNSFDLTKSQLTKFAAYAVGFHVGVSVGAQVFESDGKADILTGSVGGASHFRVVDGLATGILPPAIHNLEGFANDIPSGISVGA
jgi:hypothetical protein